MNNISKPTLFADDTCIIFFNSDSTDYATEFIITSEKKTWFAINSLSLNINKTNYVHFTANQI